MNTEERELETLQRNAKAAEQNRAAKAEELHKLGAELSPVSLIDLNIQMLKERLIPDELDQWAYKIEFEERLAVMLDEVIEQARTQINRQRLLEGTPGAPPNGQGPLRGLP